MLNWVVTRQRIYAFCVDKIIAFFAAYMLLPNFDSFMSNLPMSHNLKHPVGIAVIFYVFMLIAVSTIIDSFYAAILDSSPLRGTIGKKLFGLCVVSLNGERISFSKALLRNAYEAVWVYIRLSHIAIFIVFEIVICVIIARIVHPIVAFIFAAITVAGLFSGGGRWQNVRSKLLDFSFSKDVMFGTQVMPIKVAGSE